MPCQVGDEKNIGDLHVNADNHVKLGISARYVLAFLILTILIVSSFLSSNFFLIAFERFSLSISTLNYQMERGKKNKKS